MSGHSDDGGSSVVGAAAEPSPTQAQKEEALKDQKIEALIRIRSGQSLATMSQLVSAHLNLFGYGSSVNTEEELVGARAESTTRILRLELCASGHASQEPGADLRAVESSLAQVARRAGVQATFELFAAKAAQEVK